MTKYIEIDRLKYLLDFAIRYIIKEGELILKSEGNIVLIESNKCKKSKMYIHTKGYILFESHENNCDFDKLIRCLIKQHHIIHWRNHGFGIFDGWFCDESLHEKHKAEINMLINQVKNLQDQIIALRGV